jgi:hypothetical protein
VLLLSFCMFADQYSDSSNMTAPPIALRTLRMCSFSTFSGNVLFSSVFYNKKAILVIHSVRDCLSHPQKRKIYYRSGLTYSLKHLLISMLQNNTIHIYSESRDGTDYLNALLRKQNSRTSFITKSTVQRPIHSICN